jgi:hypothetical protein
LEIKESKNFQKNFNITIRSNLWTFNVILKINILGNNIGEKGIEEFSRYFQNNKSIEYLDIQCNLIKINILDNNIGDKGLEEFSKKFQNNNSLQHLNICCNL